MISISISKPGRSLEGHVAHRAKFQNQAVKYKKVTVNVSTRN